MTNYEKHEDRTLDKISERITKLETDLQTIDDTDKKFKSFEASEKAIHEIRMIIRDSKHFEHLEDREAKHDANEVAHLDDQDVENIDGIEKELDKLDDHLAKDDETDSRAKGYVEQKEALHNIKEILKKAGKLNE